MYSEDLLAKHCSVGLQKNSAHLEEDTDSACLSRRPPSYKKLVMKFPFSVVRAMFWKKKCVCFSCINMHIGKWNLLRFRYEQNIGPKSAREADNI
jgi:hypothetical protein